MNNWIKVGLFEGEWRLGVFLDTNFRMAGIDLLVGYIYIMDGRDTSYEAL